MMEERINVIEQKLRDLHTWLAPQIEEAKKKAEVDQKKLVESASKTPTARTPAYAPPQD